MQAFTVPMIPAQCAALTTGDDPQIQPDETNPTSYFYYSRKHEGEQKTQKQISLRGMQYRAAEDPHMAPFTMEGEQGVLLGEENLWCEWAFDIPETGMYALTAEYYPLKGTGRDIIISVLIDGSYPFDETAGCYLNRIWTDKKSESGNQLRQDDLGNDLRPAQVESPRFISKALTDIQGLYVDPYAFFLSKGKHVIRIEIKREALCLKSLTLGNEEEPISYNEYRAQHFGSNNAGEPEILQAERAWEKNSSFLYPMYDRTDAATQPNDPNLVRLNTIGQSNWGTPGTWISWRVGVKRPGLYKLAFRCRQSFNEGLNSYRTIKINGEVPFREAKEIAFDYRDDWYIKVPGDREPFLFYLQEGDVITLEATSGEMAQPLREIRQQLLNLNAIYRKIIVITGSTPDIYRDYALENQIPDLVSGLKASGDALQSTASSIKQIIGKNGSLASKLEETRKIVIELADEPYMIPERLSRFKGSIEDMGALMTALGQQPLELDYITFLSAEAPLPRAKAEWQKSLSFWFNQLIGSFFQDYRGLGKMSGGNESISVWVSTGRDQAQVVSQLINNKFTPISGTGVRLSLVDTGATLIQATLAGKGPDAALMIQQDIPVNLAMRGALSDFSRPEYGIDDIHERYHPSAWIPYRYNKGIYALPESQSFDVIFYRTDVFQELGLRIPETWDEFYLMLKILQSKNLQAGIPEIDTVNMGVSQGIATFDKFLFQNGGAYYTDELMKTLFDENISLTAFEKWVELYTEYGLDRSFDFFNRFRSGEMPFAIQNISVYNQLMQAAPEIRGLWAFAPVPGTRRRDGTIDRSETAKGHGCVMLKAAEKRGTDRETLEFLRWWVSDEIQLQFANEMEAALGVAARYYPAAIKSFEQIGWSEDELSILQEQQKWLINVPQIPGNYVLSRSLTSAFRASVSRINTPRRALTIYNKEINAEIARKRKEFKLD